ncbi:putative N6-adenine-specific DNA methylase [Pseudacidovorax intermedius]|uniref:Putative N6-adenine-specific DNA methylase n=1 Tax=Pseudacidovorax intermedius TaxID=433924 RepID=A0A370FNZ6_9BURK|nr:putative N6-adenine-specific DNA methylase [Pseudacidovorax intermedius]
MAGHLIFSDDEAVNELILFLPCAAGVEDLLAAEVHAITGRSGDDLRVLRAGVRVMGAWRDVQALNLKSRLAQRVLVQLAHRPYRNEADLYEAASGIAWEMWFQPRQTFKVELTAQGSPLQSLNFATLKIKDAIADRFRARAGGVRPSVETRFPDVRVFAHLTAEDVTLYIDTSGEPLFKRGWRVDKGDAPLKETLAAAMLAASGWWDPETGAVSDQPLYDPCCGSGTIPIEAALLAAGVPAGASRRFGFEALLLHRAELWRAMREEALAQADARPAGPVRVFGSDVSHRMVDFAQRNAERAGVTDRLQLRGGDALQRMPPVEGGGVILLNPPYGERIAVGGVAGSNAGRRGQGGREVAQTESGADGGDDFFPQLATHWKRNFAGWTAWVLTPDMKLPQRMRLKESRRVPMWNGPIECRLLRFDMVAGSARTAPAA